MEKENTEPPTNVLIIMASQEEIMALLSTKGSVTFKDMAKGLGLPWNETIRKNLNIKVQSLERYDLVAKDHIDGHVLIRINDDHK